MSARAWACCGPEARPRKRGHGTPSLQALLLALLTIVSGCDFPGKPKPADRPVPSNEIISFEVLFQQQCAGCHGADGEMGPAPPLNDPLFLAIVPDEELLRTIREGRPDTPMPAFLRSRGGTLTEAQIKVLAEGLKPRWSRATLAKNLLPAYAVTTTDESSDESITRGIQVFGHACASCHGTHGEGTKNGAGAINDRAFLELISDQELRRIVITGRPDLGMPSFDEKMGRGSSFKALTSAEISDLVSLLASWRRGADIPKKAIADDKANHSKPAND